AENGDAAGRVDGVREGAQHLAVRVGRGDAGQVLGDGTAGDGEAVAVQQPGVEQRLHDHRDATDVVDVLHHVPAEGFDVGEVRHARTDACEVVQGQLHPGFVGDGQQVQHRIGRP